MSKRIAIIPARGGSKRIPKKNIKEFCGKPIIAYAIEEALKSGIFDEVMVSTDSDEIADIAKRYGANVPFLRSEETAGDFATTADVIFEVLDKYEELGTHFEYGICVYPTAPFVTAEKIKQAMDVVESEDCNIVLPVVVFSYPPQRGYVLKDERLGMKYPENFKARSQDLERMYHDAGQFFAINVERYRQHSGIIIDGIAPMIMDEREVQDIDNETDWEIAEIKYKLMLKKD
ncbi:MAG: pseudaminic acid cytidylyltransferase [Lachnospira sp.]|nr:pseudaminic acid cytidylyltransferase [Lachnospira sp.]